MDISQLMHELRALANRWAIKAREYARDGKAAADPAQAQFYQGFAEGYYKAATDLAAFLKGETVDATDGTPVPLAKSPTSDPKSAVAPQAAAPVAPPPPPVSYLNVAVGEVINVLEFAGASPRDVKMRPGNVVYAEFSKWQPLADHERVAKIAAADPRIVILNFGRTKESNDPYVEFAFKQG